MIGSSYCGPPPLAADLAARWNLDPLVSAALAVAALLAAGLYGARRIAALAAAGTMAIVFMSPLCALSVALFSARSVHHLLLIAVAAPLLTKAWPLRAVVPPVAALVMATVALWGWHLPAAYDAALRSDGLYWLMELSLLATSWLYWGAIRQAPAPVAMMAIIGGAAQMGMLGAVITFAPRPLYVSHLATTIPFGMGPLQDQQLAGLIMWVVGLLPYALAAAWRLGGDWRRMAAA